MNKQRGLSPDFLKRFTTEDDLKSLVDFVKADDQLDLQIRDNYINIYYRGGNVIKINESDLMSKTKAFKGFDTKYLKPDYLHYAEKIRSFAEAFDWFSYFSLCKQIMDLWFGLHKKEEREFQQLVTRDNNYSTVANSTDFFILDIEYATRQNSRFDLVALEWPSQSGIRKLQNGFKPKLWVIEMKYGDGAVSGNSGIKEHHNGLTSYLTQSHTVVDFKEEMLNVFEQKRALGLIPCLSASTNKNPIEELDDDITYAFLIANHKPAKSKLKSELKKIKGTDIKILKANYFGYGLYHHNILSLGDFLNEL